MVSNKTPSTTTAKAGEVEGAMNNSLPNPCKPGNHKAVTKILIVDDQEYFRKKISGMLAEEKFEVIEAGSGVQAMETYQQKKPDIVLLDITMPEMDGLAALKKLRTLDSRAKIVMLTALGQESIVLEAIKSGARDFVVKPFEREHLLNTIAILMS
jgi:two-component system chemotaxis response regulator CheY